MDNNQSTSENIDDSTVSSENTAATEEQNVAELTAKVAELNEKYLRLYSDFDNYKKRSTKERIDLIKSAGEDVYKLLLPIIDDFERAIKASKETTDLKAINEGINLVYHKIKTTLGNKGLEEMAVEGTAFDPDLHEAITNIPAPSEELKGKIVDVLEKGYTLNGKVIRFAKVVVGS